MKEFTSQVCTDIHQSKRLLEMGLKPETADMVYEYEDTYPYNYNLRILKDGDYISSNIITDDIPAWSLHRLIEILDSPLLEFNILSYNPYEEIIYLISECIENGYISKKYLKK